MDTPLSRLRGIESNDQYRSWARSLSGSLIDRWAKCLRPLEVPRALKLINLLAKGLCVVSPIWPDDTDRVIEHLDVALDQFSLRPLSCIKKWDSLRNASMGSVTSIEQYAEIQETIRALCRQAGVPAIAYDFLAWDAAHKKEPLLTVNAQHAPKFRRKRLN